MKCDKCETEFKEEVKFCPECGTKIKEKSLASSMEETFRETSAMWFLIGRTYQKLTKNHQKIEILESLVKEKHEISEIYFEILERAKKHLEDPKLEDGSLLRMLALEDLRIKTKKPRHEKLEESPKSQEKF